MDKETLRECMRLVPLGFWVDLCHEAGVPHVPAMFSLPFPTSQIFDAIDQKTTPEMDAAFRWVKALMSERPNERLMARWECCTDGWLDALLISNPRRRGVSLFWKFGWRLRTVTEQQTLRMPSGSKMKDDLTKGEVL